MKNETIYMAYGSNLNLMQMARRCPTAKRLGVAQLEGYDLKFRGDDGHAVATVEPGEGTVPVLLWKIGPIDEHRLNIYEGWPKLYRKETLGIELDGQTMEAMVYIMNEGHPLGAPSPYYLNIIAEGYEDAGFDTDTLTDAIDRSRSTHELEMDW